MNKDDVETALQGLAADATVPTWAKVLISCITNLVGQREVSDELSPRIARLEEQMADMKAENRILKIQMAALKDELDEAEQYSRRNCLIFHGVPEERKESTTDVVLEIIHNKLGISNVMVDKKDIDRSHRLGKIKSDQRATRNSKPRNRPIIVKFKGYDCRSEVFSNKRNLKGSSVMITENLTGKRYELLKKCLIKLGKGNVWTYDGRITTKKGESYIVINNEDELNNL